MEIALTVNGQRVVVEIDPTEHLLDTLRGLGLTGAKHGCGEGTCGACTVLLDGQPVLGCLTFSAQAAEREVTTVEALGTPSEPHPLQRSFVEHGAVQCGYCTPGMLLSTKALLERNPRPSEDEIKRALDGNLCRCTGYVKIIAAVKAASEAPRT